MLVANMSIRTEPICPHLSNMTWQTTDPHAAMKKSQKHPFLKFAKLLNSLASSGKYAKNIESDL
jgi:hypothetical protein